MIPTRTDADESRVRFTKSLHSASASFWALAPKSPAQADLFAHDIVESLGLEYEGYLVQAVHIGADDHRFSCHVAQAGYLRHQIVGHGPVASAHYSIGLNSPGTELGHGMLCGFGFLLTRGTDERHQCDVDVAHSVVPCVEPQLSDRFQERQYLYIADSAAHLGDHNVCVAAFQQLDATFLSRR